jgi:hypothetical protein
MQNRHPRLKEKRQIQGINPDTATLRHKGGCRRGGTVDTSQSAIVSLQNQPVQPAHRNTPKPSPGPNTGNRDDRYSGWQIGFVSRSLRLRGGGAVTSIKTSTNEVVVTLRVFFSFYLLFDPLFLTRVHSPALAGWESPSATVHLRSNSRMG